MSFRASVLCAARACPELAEGNPGERASPRSLPRKSESDRRARLARFLVKLPYPLWLTDLLPVTTLPRRLRGCPAPQLRIPAFRGGSHAHELNLVDRRWTDCRLG